VSRRRGDRDWERVEEKRGGERERRGKGRQNN